MAPADLAVIGGGAAGLFVIREALHRQPALSVRWFAPDPHPGVAWATRCPAHLLNVPVERMGARDPADFLHWLQGEPDGANIRAGQFLPRARFGAYLDALARALPDQVWRIEARVHGLDRGPAGWTLRTPTGALDARRVVVAVGLPRHLPPAPLREAWAWWGAGEAVDADAEVLLAGSGLTAVDMVLGLRDRGHRGPITVISPTACWPEVHAPTPPLAEAAAAALLDALRDSRSAAQVVAALRRASRNTAWRAVVDALRPHSNALWQAWPIPLRARLLRHGFGQWNRHRHRMAPEIGERLAADPALRLRPGRIGVVDGRLVHRYRGTTQPLTPTLALDCRGPAFGALPTQQAWLQGLLDTGDLKPYPLGSGIAAPVREDLALVGAANFGTLLESTAIPELRAQAQTLAARWFGGGGH